MGKKTRVRASGEGTIYENKARGRWEGQYSYIDPTTGKSKRKLLTGKTQSEVAVKGKSFLRNLEDGLLPDADKTSIWTWLNRWLTDYVKPNVRIKTYEKYESSLRCYVKPVIGHIIITKIKAPDIQRLLNNMGDSAGRKKQGLSSFTVRMTRRYLSMAFDKAIEVGLISRNMVKATSPPRLLKEEIRPLSEEQAELLLKTAKSGEYIYYGCKQQQKPDLSTKYLTPMAYMVVLLTLNTGMRLGEVVGLKWVDIDFEGNSVRVNRAVVTSSHGVHFEEPKTKGSRRTIRLPSKIMQAFECYQKEQEKYAELLGDKFDNDKDLVFPNAAGKPMNTVNFTNRYFKRMIGQSGIDKAFSFHDLRHTHATLLLKKGVNIKVISERLGHSSIQLTLDTYSHVMPDMQETAVIALDTLNIDFS